MANLTEIQVPSGELSPNTEYKFRVRYHGSTYGATEWEEVIATTNPEYTITPSVGANVSLDSASKSVWKGEDVTFELTFGTGYELDTVSVGSVSGTTWTIPNITGNITPSVSAQIKTYTVSVSGDSYVSVSPASQTINHGSSAVFTLDITTGYSLSSVSHGTVTGTTWTIPSVTGNITATASTGINSYTVTPTTGSNVSVTPASRTVNHGSSTTFTLEFTTGYELDTVSFGSVSGTTWTIPNVTGNITPNVSAKIKTYTVSASGDSYVSVSPASQTINHGSAATFTISLTTGYSLSSVSHGSVSGTTWTIPNVTTNIGASASTSIDTYTVSTSTNTGATLTPTSRSVNHGSSTTFTASYSTGYEYDSISGTGASISGNTVTVSGVTSNRTVTLNAKLKTYTVSVSAGTNVSVTPASRSVTHGSNATFTLTLGSGFGLNAVSHGSVSGTTWTIPSVTTNISATISAKWTASLGSTVQGGKYYANYSGYAWICGPGSSNSWGGGINWANALTTNGYTDWFLPNKDDLNSLYVNRSNAGVTSTAYHWSSTENGSYNAWYQNFDNGHQTNHGKTYTYQVRAVRRLTL